MKNNLNYLLNISLILLSSCSKDSNSITVKGTITNPVSNIVLFNFPDSSYQTEVDSKGNFEITFSADSAQYVSFIHGERTRMFLKPRDKINITFDTNEFDETMSYKNSPESSFLAYKYMATEKKDFYGESLYLKSEDEYESYIEEYKAMILQELAKIDNTYFRKTELKNLNNSIERYLKQKQNFADRSKEELLYMWDARKLSLEYNFYGLLASSVKSEFENSLSEYEQKMLTALDRIKSLERFEEEKEKISRIISKWKERKVDYDNMPKDGDMSIDFSYPNLQEEMISLSSFKGNLVYIDVWATWCSPCIAEIPSLKKLQKDYEDQEIVFLSVSVDTDKDAWVKMLSDDDLSGVQLWADGWSEISKSYAIFGIPRFMLIDQTGRLVSVDAPRPSSNEIRKIIEERI